MRDYLNRVATAIQELKKGKMVIVVDDPDRENEGDLVFPAELVTDSEINFMLRNGTGIVCLSLEEKQANQIGLAFMVPPHLNNTMRGTPFTIPIDAKEGISTGVSAQDRAHTIRTATALNATPDDVVKPGHVFPLIAKKGGVLERGGHTEGAVDLMKIAGFQPAAVICELMNEDGTMASGDRLSSFARTHGFHVLSISDLISYRLHHENPVTEEVSTTLPLEAGEFECTVMSERYTNLEHTVLHKKLETEKNPPLVRIHSSCLTGDVLHSLRCDCHNQLHFSLKKIQEEGGYLFYLNQEGRGIGLLNKIKTYSLQKKGFDTVEANRELGKPVDARDFYLPAYYLRSRGITRIRLLTNNPFKVERLRYFGIDEINVESLPLFMNPHNEDYLRTKKEKLGHFLKLGQNDGDAS